ncbi:hypothetical protein HRI_004821500 [Hibiscus trionum]|uniref:Uncharacterized protein n=1 Tax=Hibiscus trionum TaxID=183268 RepID=A0A9W7JBB8_HIBTR|nr:hypothetical protein HRI_004821500 [Hibiscus trionum]
MALDMAESALLSRELQHPLPKIADPPPLHNTHCKIPVPLQGLIIHQNHPCLSLFFTVFKHGFHSQSEIRNLNRLWHPWERETVEYFTLGDLWNCYDEWSAYGAGVLIELNNGETIVQYYVPYLSAVQIFTGSSSVNGLREETESGDGERDLFSDSYSDEIELWRSDGCSSEDVCLEVSRRSGGVWN